VSALYAILGGTPVRGQQGVYELPCNTPLQIGFQFNGQNYFMDPGDFIIGEEGQICVGAITQDDIPDDTRQEFVWILGALFMKNVLTVFDLGAPAVGFGRLKAVDDRFGSFTVINDAQQTALGTGPFASLSPTFNPIIRTSSTFDS